MFKIPRRESYSDPKYGLVSPYEQWKATWVTDHRDLKVGLVMEKIEERKEEVPTTLTRTVTLPPVGRAKKGKEVEVSVEGKTVETKRVVTSKDYIQCKKWINKKDYQTPESSFEGESCWRIACEPKCKSMTCEPKPNECAPVSRYDYLKLMRAPIPEKGDKDYKRVSAESIKDSPVGKLFFGSVL